MLHSLLTGSARDKPLYNKLSDGSSVMSNLEVPGSNLVDYKLKKNAIHVRLSRNYLCRQFRAAVSVGDPFEYNTPTPNWCVAEKGEDGPVTPERLDHAARYCKGIEMMILDGVRPRVVKRAMDDESV